MAHGTHGIHGKGDERREPRKRKGAELFYHERRDGRREGSGDVGRELREGTRMGEAGLRGVAHGTHGIHGKGEGGGRDPEAETDFLTTKDTKGGGRERGTCRVAAMKRVFLRGCGVLE